MRPVKIVCDSSAELSSEEALALDITVVPWRIALGTETQDDNPGLRSTAFARDAIKSKTLPVATAPTPRQFSEVYQRLASQTGDIVSIHASAQFGRVVASANRGRLGLLGRCEVTVVDSLFISRALGSLVTRAARAALGGASGPEVVRLVHGAIPKIYFAFHVDALDYLRRGGLLNEGREAGTGLARSLFMVENGEVSSLQRSRRRGTPVERLVEFIGEFERIDELALLHSGAGPGLAEIETALSETLPTQAFVEHVYGPVLWSCIGPKGLGVVVVER